MSELEWEMRCLAGGAAAPPAPATGRPLSETGKLIVVEQVEV